jgi:hypothetical protein
MNARETYGSKFLRVTDLKAKKTMTRLQGVDLTEFANDGKTENKLVLTLKGLDKPLVLNKTNADILMDAFGDETDGWIGKPLTLLQAKVRFQGKLTPCIRIAEPGDDDIAATEIEG